MTALRMWVRALTLAIAAMTTLPVAGAGTFRALVIGIDGYDSYGRLTCAGADAKAVAETLTKLAEGQADRVRLFTDDRPDASQRPTQANLRAALTQLLADAQAGEQLVVFFSGHAVSNAQGGDAWLVPLEGMSGGGISLKWLHDACAASPAGGLLAILDVAHSGSSARGVAAGAAAKVGRDKLSLLLSSQDGEFSMADEKRRHTFFARALVGVLGKRLAGADAVTLAALGRAVDADLQVLLFEVGIHQRPRWIGQDPETQTVLPGRVRPTGSAANEAAPAKSATAVSGRPWLVGGVELELLPVAPGTFTMGSAHGDPDERPEHEVHLTKAYWLGRYEVTQKQYEKVMGANPSKFVGERLPVHRVTWNDAGEFCRKLSEQEKAAGRLPDGYAYRLPTEAEWEYAARAGSETEFCFANDPEQLREFGNCRTATALPGQPPDPATEKDGFVTPAPVGSYKPNAWGLCDMHGNVWEWAWDGYERYKKGAVTDPAAPDGVEYFMRTARGGGWDDLPAMCRSASRAGATPVYVSLGLGFRVALAPVIPKAPPPSPLLQLRR